jgi:threonine dehydrogenase-like Zn-dependent dehydrogenase
VRQLTLVEAGKVEWGEVEDPVLGGPREAIVRPLAVALCDIDHAIVSGQAPFPGPIALGHEMVAEVVEAADEVASARPGSRVVVPFQISCGECARCKVGQTGDCESVARLATYGFGSFGGDFGGALSDLVRVPFADAMLVPVPDGVESAAVASASDNIPDAWRTVAPPLEDRAGADVLIVGGGARSIALYAVDIAKASGAGSVTYIDTDADRLQVAEALGAEVREGPPPRRAGSFPITVDASGTHEGLACALRSTDAGGVCTCVSIFFESETPLPMLEMYTSGIELRTGRVHARAALPSVLGLVAEGRLHPERVTSRTAGWEDAPEEVLEPQTKLILSR